MNQDNGSSGVKIASLELENVKRVRAVELKPSSNGLTVIGGRNGQGKTSVLDGIAYALGGERMRPGRTTREGSATDASMRVELSNGIVVERRGKNHSLKVTDPSGKKAGQNLLNCFIEELALNLPKFMDMSDREKADELLKIIGVGDQLAELDREIDGMAEERLSIGQQKRAKRKVAEEAPYYPDAPSETVSAADLLEEQREALDRNAENARVREAKARVEAEVRRLASEADRLASQAQEISRLMDSNNAELGAKRIELDQLIDDAASAVDVDLEDVNCRIAQVDELNEMVRANERRAAMLDEADRLDEEWSHISREIDDAKERRIKLLEGAEMPLPDLDVEGGKLVYKGSAWGDMSGAEQLRVATAIVRRLKPECGFVLVCKLEQMDAETLADFGEWAESEGLQVIGTRVATDESCTIVIEDGRAVKAGSDQPEANKPKFEMGVFK